jgi:hypothetical protein
MKLATNTHLGYIANGNARTKARSIAARQRIIQEFEFSELNADVLHSLKEEGKIFALNIGNKEYFPEFQFKNGIPLPIIEEILYGFANSNHYWNYFTYDKSNKEQWNLMFWFVTPNQYLNQERPVDILDTPKDLILFAAGYDPLNAYLSEI